MLRQEYTPSLTPAQAVYGYFTPSSSSLSYHNLCFSRSRMSVNTQELGATRLHFSKFRSSAGIRARKKPYIIMSVHQCAYAVVVIIEDVLPS
jgi:hypothetical protein